MAVTLLLGCIERLLLIFTGIPGKTRDMSATARSRVQQGPPSHKRTSVLSDWLACLHHSKSCTSCTQCLRWCHLALEFALQDH